MAEDLKPNLEEKTEEVLNEDLEENKDLQTEEELKTEEEEVKKEENSETQNSETKTEDDGIEVVEGIPIEEPSEKESPKAESPKDENILYQSNLESKVLEYVQTAQRLQAEFDNYRRKSLEQISGARFDGMIDAIKELLPALDSIANAKKMITEPKLLEGFVMIENQITNAFKKLGVEKIEAENKHFDPTLHNALMVECNPDLDDDIIVSEYQAGYKLKDKIIRYSQVIVNRKEE